MRKIFFLLFVFYSCFLFAQTSNQAASASPEQKLADSLFLLGQWKDALPLYEKVIKQATPNSLTWNRLGYCYHNTEKYNEALNCYEKSLAANPFAQLKMVVESRMARLYALMKNETKAMEWLDSATNAGYGNLSELETHRDFASLRTNAGYNKIHDVIYNRAYPCMADSNARKFDFWVGEWDVYPNGSPNLVGHSKIDMVSGGCVILENWTSLVNAYSGNSLNYYIPQTGKWEQVWIGSEGAQQRPSHFINGEYKDAAMRFEFSGKNQNGDYIGRFIFYDLGPDKVRQFNEISSDGGKTWQTNYDFIYRRKK